MNLIMEGEIQAAYDLIREHPFFRTEIDLKNFQSQPVPIPKGVTLLYDKNLTMKRMKKKQNGDEGPKEIKEVKRGNLKKKNQYFMKQVRTFILTNEPKLTYYKNETEYKGEVMLSR